jgi:hypothetical protein
MTPDLDRVGAACLSATSFCGWYSYPKCPDFLRCFRDLKALALRDALCEAEI